MVVPVELYSNCSPKHYVSIFEVLRPLPCLRSLSTRRSLLIGVGGLTAAQGGAVALRAYQAATCLQKAFLLLGPFLRASHGCHAGLWCFRTSKAYHRGSFY